MAPAQLVQELPHVVPMVADPQAAFDHRGNPLRGPQLGPVAVSHGSLPQELHEAGFLGCGQPGGPAGRRLGLQPIPAADLPRIAPPEHTARVAAQAAGDLMQGQVLLEERDHPLPPRFQGVGRPMRTHGDPSFPEGSMILHYLCGSQ